MAVSLNPANTLASATRDQSTTITIQCTSTSTMTDPRPTWSIKLVGDSGWPNDWAKTFSPHRTNLSASSLSLTIPPTAAAGLYSFIVSDVQADTTGTTLN